MTTPPPHAAGLGWDAVSPGGNTWVLQEFGYRERRVTGLNA
jgi:hypothetical protein